VTQRQINVPASHWGLSIRGYILTTLTLSSCSQCIAVCARSCYVFACMCSCVYVRVRACACASCVALRLRLRAYESKWGTYRTNQPQGAVTQLGSRAVNRQRPVTWLRRIHSLLTDTHISMSTVNDCLTDLLSWMKSSKLKLNVEKTDLIIMGRYKTITTKQDCRLFSNYNTR